MSEIWQIDPLDIKRLKALMMEVNAYIYRHRFAFCPIPKLGKTGSFDDIQTDIDRGAQEMYIEALKELFPDFGIIAEEDELIIPPKNGCDKSFTIDPIDGTKAFTRMQSHGIGSMLSIISDGQVHFALIGDVCSQEFYITLYGDMVRRDRAFVPTHENESDMEDSYLLKYKDMKPLRDQYVLMRYLPDAYGELKESLQPGKIFKGLEIGRGSIGIALARLWKREIGAFVMRPDTHYPWDIMPIYGICQMLGYVFYNPANDTEFQFRIGSETQEVKEVLICVHKSNLEELKQGLRK